MTTTKQIIQNASFLSAAYVGQKLLSFVYFTLIARVVGVLDTGVYVFALSYSTICSVLVDFGLANLLQRDIAREPQIARKLLSCALGLKLVYGALTVVLGLGVVWFLSHDPLTLRMIMIAMAIMLFDSFSLTIWSVFRGRHVLAHESTAIVSSQAVVLAVGLISLYLDARLEMLMLALLAGSVWTAVFAAWKCRSSLGFWPLPSWRGESGLAKRSVSFGLASAFSRLFASLDAVLLGQMVGKAAVGYYAIPNKFVFAAQFVPAAVSASLYPALSHYHAQDKEKMRTLFLQSLVLLYVVAAPMSVGLFLLTPSIIRELYTTAYQPSILAMQILVWGIIFGFLEFPLGAYIAASGEQRKNTITRGVVVAVNVSLNLLLIPRYSFVGTAIAALVSYSVLAGMGAFWIRRTLAAATPVFWHSLIKTTACASMMGVVVYAVLPFAHFAVVIVLGAAIYTASAALTGVLRREHLDTVVGLFRKSSE